MERNLEIPSPIIDKKEAAALDILTDRYKKLTEPGKIAKLGTKASKFVPERVKKWGNNVSLSITEKELYTQIMNVLGGGFKAIEEQAAKFSLSERQIIAKINKTSKQQMEQLDEACLIRSYDIAKLVSTYKSQDTFEQQLRVAARGRLDFGDCHLTLS